MNLDERARAATDDLFTASVAGLDHSAMFRSLEKTRTNRSRTQVALVGLTAVALVLTGWLVTRPTHDQALPVQPTPSPVRISLDDYGALLGSRAGLFAAIDPITGAEIPADGLTLPPVPTDSVRSVAWSPNGRDLAFTTDNDVRVSDTRTGSSRLVGTCNYCSVAWSPSGDELVYFGDVEIHLVEARSGTDRRLLSCDLRCEAAWSPDGESLAVTRDAALEIWSRTGGAGAVIVDLGGPSVREPLLTNPAWSPDGQQIAFSTVRNLSEKTLRTVRPDGSGLRTLSAWRGRGSEGDRELVWASDSSELLYLHVAIDPSSGNDETEARIQSVALSGGAPVDRIQLPSVPGPGSSGLAWSPDKQVLATTDSNGILSLSSPVGDIPATSANGAALRGPLAWQPLTPASPSAQPSASVAIGGGGALVVVLDGRLRAINTANGAELPATQVRLPLTSGEITSASWSPDGQQLAYSQYDDVRIADVRTGASKITVPGCELCSVAWSPDGSSLAYASRGEVGIIDVPTNSWRSRGSCDVCSVSWSLDGATLAVAGPDRLELWPRAGGAGTVIVDLAGVRLHDPVWSTDGQQLAFTATGFAGERTIRTVTRDGSGLTTLVEWSGSDVESDSHLTWSPDGTRLVFIRAQQERPALVPKSTVTSSLMSVPIDGGQAETLRELGAGDASVAWSPDGTILASVGRQGLVVSAADGSAPGPALRAVRGPLAWQPSPTP